MAIRIGSVVLNLSGVLALILGLLFWDHRALNLISLHMLLGLLVVGALWVIGIGQAFFKSGSWLLATCALIIGALVLVIGMMQSAMLVDDYHWVIQIVHLALGLTAIGIGHMAAARVRKTAAT